MPSFWAASEGPAIQGRIANIGNKLRQPLSARLDLSTSRIERKRPIQAVRNYLS